MIKPIPENPLKHANTFMKMHRNLILILKTTSDVIHTQFREEVLEKLLEKI